MVDLSIAAKKKKISDHLINDFCGLMARTS